MAAKVHFGVDNTSDPIEAMQKILAGISSNIGETAKNYMLEDYYKAQLEEEKAQLEEEKRRTDLQQAAAAKQLLVRQQEFDQEMALRRAEDERNAQEHKYRMADYKRESDSYNAVQNLMTNGGIQKAREDHAVDKYAKPFAIKAVDEVVGRMGVDETEKARLRKELLPGFMQFYKGPIQEGYAGEIQKEFRKTAASLLSKEETDNIDNNILASHGVLPEHIKAVKSVLSPGRDYTYLDDIREEKRQKALKGAVGALKAQASIITNELNNKPKGSFNFNNLTNGLNEEDKGRLEQGIALAQSTYGKDFSNQEIGIAATIVAGLNKTDGQTGYNLSPEDTAAAIGKILSENSASDANDPSNVNNRVKNLESRLETLAEVYITPQQSTRSILENSALQDITTRMVGKVPKAASVLPVPSSTKNNPYGNYYTEAMYDRGGMPGINGITEVGDGAFGKYNLSNAITRDVLRSGEFTPEQIAAMGARLRDLGVEEQKIKFAQENAAKTGDPLNLLLLEAEANRPESNLLWAKRLNLENEFRDIVASAMRNGATGEQAREYARQVTAGKFFDLKQKEIASKRYDAIRNYVILRDSGLWSEQERIIALRQLVGLPPDKKETQDYVRKIYGKWDKNPKVEIPIQPPTQPVPANITTPLSYNDNFDNMTSVGGMSPVKTPSFLDKYSQG